MDTLLQDIVIDPPCVHFVPSFHGPNVFGPSIHGPTVFDLIVFGPSVHGPIVFGSFIFGPSVTVHSVPIRF